jgi:hypothetical protein
MVNILPSHLPILSTKQCKIVHIVKFWVICLSGSNIFTTLYVTTVGVHTALFCLSAHPAALKAATPRHLRLPLRAPGRAQSCNAAPSPPASPRIRPGANLPRPRSRSPATPRQLRLPLRAPATSRQQRPQSPPRGRSRAQQGPQRSKARRASKARNSALPPHPRTRGWKVAPPNRADGRSTSSSSPQITKSRGWNVPRIHQIARMEGPADPPNRSLLAITAPAPSIPISLLTVLSDHPLPFMDDRRFHPLGSWTTNLYLFKNP